VRATAQPVSMAGVCPFFLAAISLPLGHLLFAVPYECHVFYGNTRPVVVMPMGLTVAFLPWQVRAYCQRAERRDQRDQEPWRMGRPGAEARD
jgi:hypothetical protein